MCFERNNYYNIEMLLLLLLLLFIFINQIPFNSIQFYFYNAKSQYNYLHGTLHCEKNPTNSFSWIVGDYLYSYHQHHFLHH